LRRSGIVRLPLPGDWQPEQGIGSSVTVYKILLQIANATFTYQPQLRRLQSNVVLAQHRWKRTKHPSTQSWLPLPGNVISLPQAPSDSSLDEYPPIEDTVQLQVKEADGQLHPWQAVSDFSRSGPADRVFVVDRATSEIRFGDGLTGRLPVTSANDESDITVSYESGGGTAGNVGACSKWEAVAATDAASSPQFSAINLEPGDGGAETETLAAAIARSTAALNDRNRAVSQEDFVNLAQTTPGVGFRRAYAAVGYHPEFPCSTVPGAITVFVLPYAPRAQNDGDWASDIHVPAPMPDQGALQAAQQVLNAAKLIGGQVFVCPPVYRKVWLTIAVAVDSPLSVGLRQTIVATLQNFLDPLTGGDAGEGWPFGDSLRPSALLRVAQAALGSAGSVQSVSVRIDSAKATEERCKDVPIRPHELVNLMHVELVITRRPVQNGGLR
jgi:predicted phage baseplate assembly protein